MLREEEAAKTLLDCWLTLKELMFVRLLLRLLRALTVPPPMAVTMSPEEEERQVPTYPLTVLLLMRLAKLPMITHELLLKEAEEEREDSMNWHPK